MALVAAIHIQHIVVVIQRRVCGLSKSICESLSESHRGILVTHNWSSEDISAETGSDD